MDHELHKRAKAEYARLVQLPFGGWERHYAQSHMCFLRDFIAACEGRESEDVQSEYEANASLVHTLRPTPGSPMKSAFNG
jgi:hypothetical protein